MDFKNAPISSKYDSFTGKNTPFTGILLRKPFVFHMIESKEKRNKQIETCESEFHLYKKTKGMTR
ncbi:hypothetical protein COI72_02295 [Bacillus cereus]|nr:hypothetical protein CN296_19465 [Bacillus cereus]PFI43425.1 hypothetical protein COI72_02295 [Bacillus cereus]